MVLFQKLSALPSAVKQYLLITANYWTFTLTDGALRMLVVLYFHQLGYSPLSIAMLFLFYEFFGVVTNLVGGWLGARIGLNKTMNIGLSMQVVALAMLAVPDQYLTVIWVMLAQALSGIAKDLNKMSAKSSIKSLVKPTAVEGDSGGSGNNEQVASALDQQSRLYHWVALLTGSKNALKGIGYFLGTFLLAVVGFRGSVLIMAAVLAVMSLLSVLLLKQDLGKAKTKAKFSQVFSKNKALNYLAAARMCLFASRDVWFVVALPVFLAKTLNWQHQYIGVFMAGWIIFYGIIQASTPKLIKNKQAPTGILASSYAWTLAGVTAILTLALWYFPLSYTALVLVIGLFSFGGVFAINSSVHSYLVVALARDDGISLDVGFYYMANALGRLFGTVLSGLVFQFYGLLACISLAVLLIVLSALFVRKVH